MSVAITVAVDGVPHGITPTAGDLVRLEREYQIVASEMSVETMSVEWVMFLAFTALRRTKVIAMSFDEFLDLADTVEEALDPPPLPPSSD